MIGLQPPDDPFLIQTTVPIFLIIVLVSGGIGSSLGNWYSSVRAQQQGREPSKSVVEGWAGFVVGLVVALLGMYLISPDDPLMRMRAIPLQVRWYGVLIVSGAMLGTWLAAQRAVQRGIHSDHAWNQLMLGLVLGIVGARLYYVAFEWSQFDGDVFKILNTTTGGLAIHGALIGALLSVLIYTHYNKLAFWQWLDVYVPGFLLAQAIGRWGNFFNQEAYGEPTSLGFGVRIDSAFRMPPYQDLQQYPLDTLFHATFLYESVWNLCGVGVLLLLDRWFGGTTPQYTRWLRHGDILFLYCIYYSAGRFWIEGLRTDSLYLGPLRIAQVASLILILVGIGALIVNHYRPRIMNDT